MDKLTEEQYNMIGLAAAAVVRQGVEVGAEDDVVLDTLIRQVAKRQREVTDEEQAIKDAEVLLADRVKRNAQDEIAKRAFIDAIMDRVGGNPESLIDWYKMWLKGRESKGLKPRGL